MYEGGSTALVNDDGEIGLCAKNDFSRNFPELVKDSALAGLYGVCSELSMFLLALLAFSSENPFQQW